MGTDAWTVANIPLQEGFNAITLSANSDAIAYQWSADTGSFEGSTTDETARWRAPDHAGAVSITVTVTDGRGGTASTSATIDVSVAQVAQGPIGQPSAGLLLSPSTPPRR